MKLKSKSELAAEEAAKIRQKRRQWDTSKLAIVYIRQSTKAQAHKNKESRDEQSIDLVELAVEQYEWPERNIYPIDENLLDKRGNKVQKFRSASGRIDKHLRAGLRIAEELIKADKVGAVFVRDIARLFRDPDMINPPQFAVLCRDHHVVIITPSREFDFNATARTDFKDFIEEAEDAAGYFRTIGRNLQNGKERKGMRGDYAGHAVPTGLMLDEKRKGYMPNPHWCETVRWLTHRFRELDADLSALRNEILGVPIFCELPEEIKERVGRIQLRPVAGGYTIVGRGSLIDLLINPANIGHKVYNRRVVKENAHPAIVDKEDFEYAVTHLGKVDLEGNEIERPERVKRYTWGQDRGGLLAGVRENGRPVVTSSQGGVYVLQMERGTIIYSIKDNRSLSPNPYRGAIAIDTVDAALSRRLEEKLHDLIFDAEESGSMIETLQQAKVVGASPEAQAWRDEIVGKAIEERQERQRSAKAILDHISSLRKKVRASLGRLDETIADVKKAIALEERDYSVAKEDMSDHDMREHFATLKRLRLRLADLEEKRARDNQVDKDIDAIQKRLTTAKEKWGEMDMEERRSFIRLITNDIRLDTLSGRWMKLTIEWSPLLAGENYIEFVLFLKTLRATPRWTREEDATLKAMYPQSPKDDILAALPRRSWHAITMRVKGRSETQAIMDTLSLEDLAVMNEYGIKQEWIEGGCTEYWGTEDTDVNSGGLSSYAKYSPLF